jgi:hypothetical protein
MNLVWAIPCIVVGSVLLVLAVRGTPSPLRRRRTDLPPPPVEPLPDDFPTTPIPLIPDRPAVPGTTVDRLMLRPDELLWHKGAEDGAGVITLGLLPEPAGQLGVLMDVDGFASGVRLDRSEVQGLRDALTCHLVDTSTSVTR